MKDASERNIGKKWCTGKSYPLVSMQSGMVFFSRRFFSVFSSSIQFGVRCIWLVWMLLLVIILESGSSMSISKALQSENEKAKENENEWQSEQNKNEFYYIYVAREFLCIIFARAKYIDSFRTNHSNSPVLWMAKKYKYVKKKFADNNNNNNTNETHFLMKWIGKTKMQAPEEWQKWQTK